MARNSRRSRANLNFDGLTDAVTNLTGAMILLVVLLLGITREAQPESEGGPPPQPVVEVVPIDPLMQQAKLLKAQIQAIEAQIETIEREIPALEDEVKRLTEQASRKDRTT